MSNHTPAELGTLLCGNAYNKHGASIADPQSMLVSHNFESFCEGRGFDKVQRRECEEAYQARWKELTRE